MFRVVHVAVIIIIYHNLSILKYVYIATYILCRLVNRGNNGRN